MSKRIDQVNELLLQNIGQIIIEELEVPKDFLFTLTKVDTAPDIKNAKVYFSVVPKEKNEEAEEFINNNSYLIQKAIGKTLTFRNTPKLRFIHDSQEDRAERIESLLDNIDNKE